MSIQQSSASVLTDLSCRHELPPRSWPGAEQTFGQQVSGRHRALVLFVCPGGQPFRVIRGLPQGAVRTHHSQDREGRGALEQRNGTAWARAQKEEWRLTVWKTLV